MGAMGHGKSFLLAGPSNAGLLDPAQFSVLTQAQILQTLFMSRPSLDYEAMVRVFDVLVKRCQDALGTAHREVERRSNRDNTEASLDD